MNVAFGQPWDLHTVKPSFFSVPACVVFGERAETSAPLVSPAEVWSGRLPVPNASWEVAARHLSRATPSELPTGSAMSPYATRFANGATVFPRVLLMVEEQPTPALGAGAGRKAVRSRRSPLEKPPWKKLPTLDGNVESAFIRPLYLSDNLLPYRLLPPHHAVIPWNGTKLLDGSDDHIDDYPGLAAWWRNGEKIWNAHRSSDRLTLLGRLDFRHGLSSQFPLLAHRVVYTKGGMYLAAARVSDPSAVIENTLYWAATSGIDEARYLTAILNSDTLTQLVRPLQARGEHNPRHFDKYIFRLPIPLYNEDSPEHRQLVDLAERAEQVAQAVELPSGVAFQALRRRITKEFESSLTLIL